MSMTHPGTHSDHLGGESQTRASTWTDLPPVPPAARTPGEQGWSGPAAPVEDGPSSRRNRVTALIATGALAVGLLGGVGLGRATAPAAATGAGAGAGFPQGRFGGPGGQGFRGGQGFPGGVQGGTGSLGGTSGTSGTSTT